MAIDAIKIPQNVEVEDRIIGPVSLRQLIIVLIGGGISYALWSTMKAANGGASDTIQTAIAWIPALIAAAFAFININHVSLSKLCLLLIEKIDKPSVRVWSPRPGLSINIILGNHQKQDPNKQAHYQPAVNLSTLPINELSQALDTAPSLHDPLLHSVPQNPAATANNTVFTDVYPKNTLTPNS